MTKRMATLAIAASLGWMGSDTLFGARNVGRPGSPGVRNRRKSRKRQKQARRKNR